MASSGPVSALPATTVQPGHNQPPTSSSMASNPSSTSSKPSTAPLTVEAVLASANGSFQAALDAVIAERNSLSSQNSQLWKLIEKQRVGYANVLKEVERLKAERDRAYAKLDGEHGPRRAKDRPSPAGSDAPRERTSSHSTPSGPRPQPHRHQSDGPAEDLSRDHGIPASGSYDPHRPVNGISGHAPHSTSIDHTTSSDPVIPPPRKGSFSSQHAPNLPTVAPLSFGNRSVKADPPPHGPLPIFGSTPPQAEAISPVLAPAPLHGQNLSPTQPMLGVYSQPDDSRGSRITLPDEASRYIANMQDSPIPSPQPATGAFAHANSPPSHTTGVNGQSQTIDSPRHHHHPPPTVVVQPLDDHTEGASKEPQSHMDFDDDASDDDRNNMSVPPTLITDHDATPTQPRPVPGHQNDHDYNREYLDASPSLSSQNHMDPRRASPTSDDESRGSSPLREYPPQQIASQQPQSRPPYLSASELVYTSVKIVGSNIRANDRGKEVLSFVVEVVPPDREAWKIEKLYSDVLALDVKVRAKLSRSQMKKIAPLPDAKLFKDNAPAKVDQRKQVLEAFLQSLLTAPVKDPTDICAFFTADIIRADARAGVGHSGYKEGYLTKRGKNFGGWKTRYFVLQSSVLEYYESRGGTHLGSITITGSQIGRQQKSASARDPDDENAYRHAFLIIEAKKGPNGSNTRHVLCAESDAERDSWVEVLVRYVVENPEANGTLAPDPAGSLPRASTSSTTNLTDSPSGSRPRNPPRGLSKDEISKGQAVPISQLGTETHHPKLFPVAPPPGAYNNPSDSSSPSTERSGVALTDAQVAQKLLYRGPTPGSDAPLSSSLPESNPLSQVQQPTYLSSKRSNSEMGHYSDLKGPPSSQSVLFPETPTAGVTATPRTANAEGKHRHRASYQASMPSARLAPIASADPPSPDTPSGGITPTAKKIVSPPTNGMIIPAGYKFGQKESPVNTEPVAATTSDRATKVKSKFWPAFGRSDKDKSHSHSNTEKSQTTSQLGTGGSSVVAPGGGVFGVSLTQSLSVAEKANLPAVVFRCIEYLEAKKADQEEGIYRLSGSSAVIKSLRDRFNMEGDIDLLKADEYWDPHAIAGLLKTFLRELPTSILTRDLHMRFLSVIDLMDPQERIAELATLIAALPPPNYALLRALTAHLILVVQNATVNKMNMRNVGIVFSPTLGIPAGVFSLMLGEFNRVFNVDGSLETSTAAEFPAGSTDMPEANTAPAAPRPTGSSKRNSQLYADGAADLMLGLGGRSLPANADDSDDGGQSPILEESEGENETEEGGPTSVLDSSVPSETSSPPTTPGPQMGHHQQHPDSSNNLTAGGHPGHSGHAKDVALKHGLQISTTTPLKQKRISYLPTSPRPPGRHPTAASATMKETPINESPR